MKKKITLTTSVCILLFQFGVAQEVSEFFSKADDFFAAYVKNGKVAYKVIKENPTTLNELIDLANVQSVSENDKNTYQAFWINTYNLSVIKGIVDNYPIKSPLDKAGFFDKIKYSVGGKTITLNDIENKILRENFPKEARFHFVLVCAGLGCPPIISNAYLPSTLEAQLQRQTEMALNNTSFIKVKGNKVQISQLFDWYKGDFTQEGKSLIDFLNQYRNEKIDSKAKVGYYDYNWALNEIK